VSVTYNIYRENTFIHVIVHTYREIKKPTTTVIYYMDYSPLSKIRKLNEMDVADSLLGM
jgi:hypothetical protein